MRIRIHPERPQGRLISQVVECLRKGGVISYPTDTVYGIGCDIMRKKAIEKIYQIKGLPRTKLLAFMCSDLTHISQYARISNYAYRVMRRLVPGPYCFVLPATRLVPRLLESKRRTVGIRVPDSPLAQAFLRELGSPIVSTSCNLADHPIIQDPDEIDELLGRRLDMVVDAGWGGDEPSTILDLTGEEAVVLREGKGLLERLP